MPIKDRTTCARPELRVSQEPGSAARLCRLGGRKLSGPPLARAMIGWLSPGGPFAVAPLTPSLANWPGCFGEQQAFHHYLAVGLSVRAADTMYCALGTRLLVPFPNTFNHMHLAHLNKTLSGLPGRFMTEAGTARQYAASKGGMGDIYVKEGHL